MGIASRNVIIRRAGPSLVATFQRANPPLIWRFDLERNHSFTLALQGEESEWELGVTSARGEFYPVARFALREDAEEAFAAVSKALMKNARRWTIPKILGLLAVILLCALTVFGVLVGRDVMLMTRGLLPTSAPQAAVPEIKNGVPEPADQALQPPP